MTPVFPVLKVEIAFTTAPLATPVWTDITQYVRHIPRIRRGRQSALTQVESAEAILVLDNRDRRFDPTYSGSPYYPNVLPMKRIRISATLPPSGLVRYLYDGYVQSWIPQWEASNQNGEITITASDAFIFFNQIKVSGSFSAEYSDQAINTFLTAIGWPTGSSWRSLTGARSLIAAQTLTNKTALQHIVDIVNSENGVFFMDRRGRAVFQGRNQRILTPATGITFGDGGYIATGEWPYNSLSLSYNDQNIYNDIRITPPSGTTQTVTDSASQAAYFKRTLTRNVLFGDATPFDGNTPEVEALGLARWLKNIYRNPGLIVERMTLDGNAAGVSGYASWVPMLGLDISDKITIKRRPPPAGSAVIANDYWIEGQEMSITDITNTYARWRVTFQLSVSNPEGLFWILGDSAYSVLGESTYVGF